VRQIAVAQIGEVVADMVKCKAQVNEHEATEKANRIQAWQSLSDWQLTDRFDKHRSVLLFPGSGWSGQHEPEFENAGWWQKPTDRPKCKQCAQCGVVKKFGKDFHKTQLGRSGRCLACKGGIRTTNLSPQQPLIGMIFTNADPTRRYASRFDDKQGSDIIVKMERVGEAIAFNDDDCFYYHSCRNNVVIAFGTLSSFLT